MRTSFVLLSAAALLAACSNADQAQQTKTEGQAPAASASPSPPQAALAARTPKPGLWRQTISNNASPQPVTIKTCVGPHDPDEKPFAFNSEGVQCSKYDVRPVMGGLEFHTVCGAEGVSATTEGKVTGDMNRAYRAEMNIKSVAPDLPGGTLDMAMTVDAVRLGDCPAGAEPGQIIE